MSCISPELKIKSRAVYLLALSDQCVYVEKTYHIMVLFDGHRFLFIKLCNNFDHLWALARHNYVSCIDQDSNCSWLPYINAMAGRYLKCFIALKYFLRIDLTTQSLSIGVALLSRLPQCFGNVHTSEHELSLYYLAFGPDTTWHPMKTGNSSRNYNAGKPELRRPVKDCLHGQTTTTCNTNCGGNYPTSWPPTIIRSDLQHVFKSQRCTAMDTDWDLKIERLKVKKRKSKSSSAAAYRQPQQSV